MIRKLLVFWLIMVPATLLFLVLAGVWAVATWLWGGR